MGFIVIVLTGERAVSMWRGWTNVAGKGRQDL
jgi:hypothetical protein